MLLCKNDNELALAGRNDIYIMIISGNYRNTHPTPTLVLYLAERLPKMVYVLQNTRTQIGLVWFY
jgi:hypothetical protein